MDNDMFEKIKVDNYYEWRKKQNTIGPIEEYSMWKERRKKFKFPLSGKNIASRGAIQYIEDIDKFIWWNGGRYYDSELSDIINLVVLNDDFYDKIINYNSSDNKKKSVIINNILDFIKSHPDAEIVSESNLVKMVSEHPNKVLCNLKKILPVNHSGKQIFERISDYTVIDLETTGLSTKNCEIIEMSAVKVRNGQIVDQFETLIKPNAEIPYIVTLKTNITNEMVESAPKINDKLHEYLDFIGDDIVLGHNIDSYDIPILCQYCEELNLDSFDNDSFDTLKFSRKCDIDVPDNKLTTLTKYFKIEHKDAHRALSDCIANHECYQRLQEFYNPDSSLKRKSSGARKYNAEFSDETKQLQELNVLVMEIICDNILTEDEILFLNNWLERNKHLSGNYPFDTIYKAVSEVLEDNIITNEEKVFLLDVLSNFSNPVESYSENIDNVDLTAKQIVLTGDFINGTKAEIVSKLEMLGAIVKSGVSSKTDYVIVGGYGSDNWACGNYGSKVKKALELQSKGKDVKIIKEEEFFKCLKATV